MASPLALAMMQPGANTPGQLQPTNALGADNLSQNAAETNYQAQLAQQNAMFGGLAGLGSAGILAAPSLFAPGGPLSQYATAVDAGTAGGVGTGGFNFLDAAAPAVASDDAFTAAAPVAADLAASAAPAAAGAAGSSIADLLPFLATVLA